MVNLIFPTFRLCALCFASLCIILLRVDIIVDRHSGSSHLHTRPSQSGAHSNS